MQTWVISLKSAGQRRILMDEQMKELITYNYFEAFTPSDIEDFVPYFDSSDIYLYRQFRIPEAVIACAKSHFYIWKKSIAGDENILVLEDDAQFINELAVKAFQQLKLPEEFDIFYLDGNLVGEPLRIIRPVGFHFSHSYIVSPHGAAILINEVERNGFKRAVDWQIFDMQPKRLCAYALSVPLFRQSAGDSAISAFQDQHSF